MDSKIFPHPDTRSSIHGSWLFPPPDFQPEPCSRALLLLSPASDAITIPWYSAGQTGCGHAVGDVKGRGGGQTEDKRNKINRGHCPHEPCKRTSETGLWGPPQTHNRPKGLPGPCCRCSCRCRGHADHPAPDSRPASPCHASRVGGSSCRSGPNRDLKDQIAGSEAGESMRLKKGSLRPEGYAARRPQDVTRLARG
jgi:hypothetical protein